MKTSEIRDLIDFISNSGLNEVNIETSELKLHVKREPDQKVFKSHVAPATTVAMTPPTHPVVASPSAPQPLVKSEATPQAQTSKLIDIKSPMIGTFYRSSNPDSPPLVSVGDKITKGQTICIIEAMKLFNEIESEVSGTLVKAMVENSSPVEYDQILFQIDPD
ncbi:MAG: acetyl-CoA carboxylase biotin carboxyl carrier protein [Flammeovirgaceae bacterium]|nr:acetyl-CoA carboxylase biotin carboxyl carrier protein [Flammeovirgaceae bacterium]